MSIPRRRMSTWLAGVSFPDEDDLGNRPLSKASPNVVFQYGDRVVSSHIFDAADYFYALSRLLLLKEIANMPLEPPKLHKLIL